jgi:hypothetical protein
MVILHIEVIAVIIFLDIAFPVMGRIDKNLAVKDVNSRISHIVVGY